MNQKNGRTDPGPLRERARSLFISQATIDETLEWATPRQLDAIDRCFASMFVRQVRQCFSAVWADGFPRCRHRFPVM